MGNYVLIRITGQETVPPLIKVQYKSRIVFLFTADHLLCRIADGEAPGALRLLETSPTSRRTLRPYQE